MAKKQSVTIEFTGEAGDLRKELNSVTGALQEQEKQLKSVEAGFRTIGLAAGAAAAAIGGVFALGTKEFISFDNAIKQSGVVSGSIGTKELAGLREEVQRLGVETSKAPAEVAQMSVQLSRAGFTAQETTVALEGIVKASEATGESLAIVGDITAKTVRTFGLTADESGRINDILVKTANTTNTSVASIGESLIYVGSVARGSNQPIEDIAIAIGLLGDAGIQGSSAGTNLAEALERLKVASAGQETEFSNLVRGSAKATSALDVIGGQVRDTTGQLKPLTEIIPIVKAGLEGLSQQDKDILLKALFGVQGGRAFNTLLQVSEERIATVSDGINNAGGAAEAAGTQMLEGLGGALQVIDGSIKTAIGSFGELSAEALEPVVRAANGMLTVFNELSPPLKNAIILTTGFAGILAAATAAITLYNVANGAKIIAEVKAAAATVAHALSLKGLAFSAAVAADSILAFTASIAPLLAKLALVVAAVESVRQAYLSVARDGGADFRASTEESRKALLELEVQTKSTAETLVKELKPARRSWTDFFGFQATREVNQAKIAVRDYRDALGNTIEAAMGLGDSAEDTAKKQELLTNEQARLTKQIEALNETELGTEAYRELRAELDVSQKELDKWAGLLGVSTKKSEDNAAATQAQTQSSKEDAEAIAAQTEALKEKAEAEAEAEKVRREAEKRTTSQQKEDTGVTESRAREDAQRKRQEDNAKAIADIQTAQQLESAKLTEKQQADLQAKQKQFEAEQAALKQQQTTEEEQKKLAFEATLSSQKDVAAEKERAIALAEKDAAAVRERNFADEIETLKDEAATRRQAAEKALAEEIANRLDQQAESFGIATQTISQAGELAAAATDEERQKLTEEFNRLDAQARAIANLNLADQVFSPEQLIATAEQVSGVVGVKSAEDAKKLRDALAAIEAEQKQQQAEADKAREVALQAELQATAKAFDDELKAKQRAFEAETQAINLANETAKRGRDKAFDAELNQQKLTFEAAQKAQRLADEAELLALKTQQEAILLEKKKADELAIAQLKAQQEAVLEAKRKAFEDSERILQRNFEDEQRAKERAFNEAERLKDEASAKKIADILEKAKPPEAAVTNVTPRFKGGAVMPGQLYLGGEINPEPIAFGNGKTAMVGLNGPELFRVPQSGMVYPSIKAMAGVGGSDNSALLAEVQRLNQTLSLRSPSGSDTYNIVGAQDPVRATIKLQQERIKQRARMARI